MYRSIVIFINSFNNAYFIKRTRNIYLLRATDFGAEGIKNEIQNRFENMTLEEFGGGLYKLTYNLGETGTAIKDFMNTYSKR